MTQNLDRGSAKILHFPVGGRAGLRGIRKESTSVSDDVAPSRSARVASGGAWYHEEAMRDCDRSRKN